MSRVGVINKSNQKSFIELITEDFEYNLDESITIRNSEIVFFFDDVIVLPNNTFDTKKLNDTIESWGYCFENEIDVSGKVFVIGSNLNPNEFQRINEILNPMNIEVVYLPPTSDVNQGKIVLGTLNPLVISKLQSTLVDIGFKNLSITSMSTSSAEIVNLLENNLNYLKHTYNKMIDEVLEDKGDGGIINNFLRLGNPLETLEMKLKNDVLQSYIEKKSTPINFGGDINYNLDNHNIYVLNYILDTQKDLSVPLLVGGITYENSDVVDSRKMFIVLELIKRGYTVHVFEDDKFLNNKKIINELSHDFGDSVKFYRKGSDVVEQIVSL
jgi:hypothetical protein